MSHAYEIEIKSLLGGKERADKLKAAMRTLDNDLQTLGSNKQLNHYFAGDGDVLVLEQKLSGHLSTNEQRSLKNIIADGSNFSIRTRKVDDKSPLFVIKAAVDHTSSSNGITRMEFEAEICDLSLEDLDQLLLDSGFEYQAKWSREREEYVCKGTNVCLDRNAGYGYLAEFERVVDETHSQEDVRSGLRELMDVLQVEELQQDRLERMFAFYNEHWPEYYGTEKIFVVE